MSMKVLVATDGSEKSMKAVRKALELAEKEGARVTLMSVSFNIREDLDEIPLSVQDKLTAQAKDALSQGKALFESKGIQVETVLERGFVPANNIVQRAKEENFDAIVLGSTGVSALEQVFLGSTAGKVAAHAPCSVFIIR